MAQNRQMNCCGTGEITGFMSSTPREVLQCMLSPTGTSRKATYFTSEAVLGGTRDDQFPRTQAFLRVFEENDLGDVVQLPPIRNPNSGRHLKILAVSPNVTRLRRYLQGDRAQAAARGEIPVAADAPVRMMWSRRIRTQFADTYRRYLDAQGRGGWFRPNWNPGEMYPRNRRFASYRSFVNRLRNTPQGGTDEDGPFWTYAQVNQAILRDAA